jgi:hypothetical protein
MNGCFFCFFYFHYVLDFGGGWLLSKHLKLLELFCDPRIEISMPNNPHNHILKVSQVPPLARNGCQSWTFSG